MADSNGIFALDVASGRELWHRAMLEGERELFLAPSGHFACDFDDLEGLLFHGSGPWRRPLEKAVLLFDPKRVRAARAGVRLAPVSR